MRLGAIVNKLEEDLKNRKITGCVFIKLDVRDGGIGNVSGFFDAAKVSGGNAVFMTDNASYVLKEIFTK